MSDFADRLREQYAENAALRREEQAREAGKARNRRDAALRHASSAAVRSTMQSRIASVMREDAVTALGVLRGQGIRPITRVERIRQGGMFSRLSFSSPTQPEGYWAVSANPHLLGEVASKEEVETGRRSRVAAVSFRGIALGTDGSLITYTASGTPYQPGKMQLVTPPLYIGEPVTDTMLAKDNLINLGQPDLDEQYLIRNWRHQLGQIPLIQVLPQ